MYLGHSKVFLTQRCPYFRGVLQEGFHCSILKTTMVCTHTPEGSHCSSPPQFSGSSEPSQ